MGAGDTLILTVTWINATRPKEEKVLHEEIYRQQLLSYYHSPEKAKQSSDSYARIQNKVLHDWARANYYARRATVRGLTAHETGNALFRVSIE